MKKTEEKFDAILHKNLLPYIKEPKSKAEKEALSKRLYTGLFGEKVPEKYPRTTPLEPLERFLMDIMFNYFEIKESLSHLSMIALLIKQYPNLQSWKKAGITKTKYLRYHYENFFNEVYLFKERVLRLLRDIKKKCKKQKLENEAKEIKSLEVLFTNVLKNICAIRGRHVHQRRYEDEKIEQLAVLELFSEDMYFEHLKNIKYEDLRRKLSKQIIEISKQLDKALNVVLDKIKDTTFTKLMGKYKKHENKYKKDSSL